MHGLARHTIVVRPTRAVRRTHIAQKSSHPGFGGDLAGEASVDRSLTSLESVHSLKAKDVTILVGVL